MVGQAELTWIKKKSETQKCVSESIYMYQSLYVSVSCPVYIVVCLMLFIYGRVSVRAYTCIKVCMFVCLVLYILSYVLCYLFMGVCQWEHIQVSKFVCLCVLSCTYCRMSYVIYLWACVSESMYMYQSLYVCVSCPVHIVVCLMLFIYGRVSMRAYTCIKVCMLVCLVLYILSYVLCYFIMF
jgi:hypothetical protein